MKPHWLLNLTLIWLRMWKLIVKTVLVKRPSNSLPAFLNCPHQVIVTGYLNHCELKSTRPRCLTKLRGRSFALYAGNELSGYQPGDRGALCFQYLNSHLSAFTDKVIPELKQWQQRPLEKVYSFAWLDAIHYKTREDGRYQSKAAYTVLALNLEGKKKSLACICLKVKGIISGCQC